MTTTRLYVDANIFIYAFEGTDVLGATLIALLTTVGAREQPFFATSELTLAETVVAPYRSANDRLIDLYERWTISGPHLMVSPITRSVLWQAAVLRSSHANLKLPDAIHLSTALLMGCSHFLTADTRLNAKYELPRRRHGLDKGPINIEVMRPEPDVIHRLIEAASR